MFLLQQNESKMTFFLKQRKARWSWVKKRGNDKERTLNAAYDGNKALTPQMFP